MRLGRQGGGRVDDGLVFDGRQSAQPGLPAPAVIGPLDPRDDRGTELIAAAPRLPGQGVLLQQREERLHRRVIAGSTDSAHRPDQIVPPDRGDVFPRSKLRSAVRVDDAPSYVAAARDRHIQGIHREVGLHP